MDEKCDTETDEPGVVVQRAKYWNYQAYPAKKQPKRVAATARQFHPL